MVRISSDSIFITISQYAAKKAQDVPQQSSTILWIKKENGHATVLSARITGIWNKICTIGFVNTLLCLFHRGDASLKNVIHFLNQDEVTREVKARRLSPFVMQRYHIAESAYDDSVARLNALAIRKNIVPTNLQVTQAEREQFTQDAALLAESDAESMRQYQVAMDEQRALDEQRAREEAIRKLAEDARELALLPPVSYAQVPNLHDIVVQGAPQGQHVHISSHVSQVTTGSTTTGHIQVTQVINGVQTDFRHDF